MPYASVILSDTCGKYTNYFLISNKKMHFYPNRPLFFAHLIQTVHQIYPIMKKNDWFLA